jgi:hypothetical protein
MKLKHGVKLTGVRPELIIGLRVADGVWRDFGQELVVTSLLDGHHSSRSLHYAGFAADLRTRYFEADKKREVSDALEDALPDDFDVVLEGTHIHLEYQPCRS